ncbi:helix-turn-helix domain-containing protein, partial [Lactobacillus delbrueckii subsp. bulgaricus]
SNRAIARELNCSPSTVGYELKRGTVSVYRYKAVEGQSTYELHKIKFKSITTDNGSEFADLSDLEQVSKTLVYYAHPYTSCDKGSVER